MNPRPAGDETTDEDLIARWKAGDGRGATAIVERHADAVGRFAVSLGEREDVEELVQDTFVKAFAAIDGFRGDSSLRTWLFTIARRLVLDRRRAAARDARMESVDEAIPSQGRDALDSIVADEDARRIRSIVGSLSPMQRDVFRLRVEQGLSYGEIAASLGTTEGAARVHYHNALRAVKEQIDD